MSIAPLLLHVFPTFAVGGSQIRFAAIANHFGVRYRHAVVSLNGVYDCFKRLDAHVDAERWRVSAPKHNTVGNVLAFRRILRERKPDLLVTYNWGAVEWAIANRPRIVPHIHIEDGFGCEEATRQLQRRVLTRRLALRKSTVVLPSHVLHRIALERWQLPRNRVHYIPNGIDIARFAARHDPIPLPPGKGPVIGTVAVLRAEKNIERLLGAFRAIRERVECRLIIAGDGPKRGALERMASQILPPRSTVFLGQVDAVERVYAAMDIFALSSDTEQMPTSLMEAMAAGLPAVATDVGDVREMIAPENLSFVVPRDDCILAEALLRAVLDAGLRRSIGYVNRTRAAVRFDIGRMFRDYETRFEHEIANSPTTD